MVFFVLIDEKYGLSCEFVTYIQEDFQESKNKTKSGIHLQKKDFASGAWRTEIGIGDKSF